MKSFLSTSFLATALFVATANAHTYVWSVWINGVDQGTGVGIREPAYNGPPLAPDRGDPFGQGSGYSNSPVRDLNSIDMRCNVLGDIPDPTTLQVKPGDVVTFEWHHESRMASDDIIASSHAGAGLVYISPNPPTSSSWVKIQEEGEGPKGTWYVTGKHTQRKGKQDVAIPPGLAPGQYLLRSELLTLHEADANHVTTPNRGIQIYITCVQIEVTGTGTVKLPTGVGFPGAYSPSDPGIIYNLYNPPTTLYKIPGPTVWSGAAPSPPAPNYGTVKGATKATRWSTWIGNGFSEKTAQTSLTIVSGTVTTTKTYVPNWPTTYVPPPSTTPEPSSSTSIPVSTPSNSPSRTSSSPAPTNTAVSPIYGQCGGINWTGPTACVSGTTCKKLNDYYFQCLP